MSHKITHFDAPLTGVERACQIAKQLFNHARGQHVTDAATINAVARHARLTPAALRRFLQPSRRPKDISFTVWHRLLDAYRRYLARELAALEDEIDRLRHLDPDDAQIEELLVKAENLCGEIRSALAPLSSANGQSE